MGPKVKLRSFREAHRGEKVVHIEKLTNKVLLSQSFPETGVVTRWV